MTPKTERAGGDGGGRRLEYANVAVFVPPLASSRDMIATPAMPTNLIKLNE
jgi:hypothetical protein